MVLAERAGLARSVGRYDYQGRRIAKRVYNWSGGQWVADPLEERRFVWHDWLMLEELSGGGTGAPAANAPLRQYTWGLDLAGLNGSVNSLQAAGGIGGLLAVHQAALDRPGEDNDVGAGDFAFAYDGNGNVVQVLDLKVADWQDPVPQDDFEWHGSRLAARYEYDAYGNVIGPDTNSDGQFDELDAPGHYAAENALRFSTKYFDRETGLGYWGYRYYSPALGRWVSRDPIGEVGGYHLYAYLWQTPFSLVDALGLEGERPLSDLLTPEQREALRHRRCGFGELDRLERERLERERQWQRQTWGEAGTMSKPSEPDGGAGATSQPASPPSPGISGVPNETFWQQCWDRFAFSGGKGIDQDVLVKCSHHIVGGDMWGFIKCMSGIMGAEALDVGRNIACCVAAKKAGRNGDPCSMKDRSVSDCQECCEFEHCKARLSVDKSTQIGASDQLKLCFANCCAMDVKCACAP